MSNSDDIVSREALRQLTGYAQPKKQCAWLAAAGIWFKPDRAGRPATTWYHVNNPLSLRLAGNTDPALTEPDFDAM